MHWRRSALNSAGALQDGGGEFRGIYTLLFTINFRGEPKSGGASAPAAPPSSAPMNICLFSCHFLMLNCLLFIQPPKNLCFVTPLTLFVLSSATDEFLKYILDKKASTLDALFRQIKSCS